MDNPLVISLVVTGIGMLMLFLALAILYGLMYLMTRMTSIRAVIKEGPEAGAGEQGSRGAEEQRSKGAEEERVMRRRAAAIAVALARAERELGHIGTPGAEETTASPWRVSPWRALHHQRQLTRKLPARRVR
jgi:Na+-transporting methylmalonyl-CoA/oxaloacetate decarboxylase gamma subunit